MKLNIQKRIQIIVYAFAILGVISVVYLGISVIAGGRWATTVSAQQDPFLSQRLNRIEQRFTTIESRLIQIEQQSRYQAPVIDSSSANRETEIRLLRSEIEALRLRVVEAECGLITLDERTLSNTARQAQKKSGAIGKSDVCRQSPNTALQLSARP